MKLRHRIRFDAGVEFAKHRQAQFSDRPVLDRIRELGQVTERHGSLGNGVLIIEGIGLIARVVMPVVSH